LAEARKRPWLAIITLAFALAFAYVVLLIPDAALRRGGSPGGGQADAEAAQRGGSSNSKPFTFVVLGDSQPAGSHEPIPKVFSVIVDEVNALKPAFVVQLGDRIHGMGDTAAMERQFEDYMAVAGRLTMPVYMAVGNHEIDDSRDNEALFRRLLKRPNLYYSFTYGNSCFAVLNTEIVGESARIAGAQFEWLRKDLARNVAKTHRFVFMHRPLFPVDGHIGRCLDKHPNDRARFIALLTANGVKNVFAGHEHLYNKTEIGGLTEYITGGCGAPIYPSIVGTGMYHHYLVVKVAGKKVTVTVVKPKAE